MENHNENSMRMDAIHTDLNTAYIQVGSEVLFLTADIKMLEITIPGTSFLPIEFISTFVI